MNCRLCLNICETEDVFNIFDDKLDLNLPQLIAKYLLIIVDPDENIPDAPKDLSNKICRMCFVHLLDFHYFYQLIEQQQQRLWQKEQDKQVEPKSEKFFDIICLSESENDDHDVDIADGYLSESSKDDVHVINEADDCKRNGTRENYFTVYNAMIERTNDFNTKNDTNAEDTKENVMVKMEYSEVRAPCPMLNETIDVDKFVYDDDSEPEIIANEGTLEENYLQGDKQSPRRKRKKTYKAIEASNASLKRTLIRLRRRKKNIYEIVDENGHLRRQLRRENNKDLSESNSDTSYNDPDYLTPRANNNKNPGRKSDRSTVEIISNNGQLTCDVCYMNHVTFADLIRHFHRKHVDLRPYAVCCDKRHYSPKVLANHILSHSNPDLFKCEICDKVLGTQYSYKQHKLMKHSGRRKTFHCHICGKRLVSEKYFDVHVANHS